MREGIIPIAWNGISLSVPDVWQLVRIDSRHLVFEENGAAIMELKWNQIRGRFSAKSHLKRLTAAHGKRNKVDLEPKPLPAEWSKALEGFQVDGFEWNSRDTSGRGAVLYCPVCRTATLIQFFKRDSLLSLNRFVGVLGSYRDHRDDGLTVWSVFDIRAVLPRVYLLTEHIFKPGNFSMAFMNKSRSLNLFRWAPAAALLGDQSLGVFASAVIGLAADQFTSGTVNGYPATRWHIGTKTRKPWPLGRTGGTTPYRQGGIWLIEDHNRILGVSLTDRRPITGDQLSEICASYEIVA